jgi:hypothetical protein
MGAMLDGQPEAVLAECARQHRRVMRGAVFTGILLVVLLAATTFAAATERYHGPVVVLIPVLFALNGMRLLRCVAGIHKIRKAERLIRQAQPRLPAAATAVIAALTALLCGERRNHHDHPGAGGGAGGRGLAWGGAIHHRGRDGALRVHHAVAAAAPASGCVVAE